MAQVPATACGVRRWPVKVMLDDDTGRVAQTPVAGTIAELGRVARPDGPRLQRGRAAPHEVTIYRVLAVVRQMSTQADGDWHLVLADPDAPHATMIGEVPDSACALGSPFAGAYNAVRRRLRGISRGAIVEVTGVGFFDHPHGQHGAAPNNFELHPVIGIAPVAVRRDSGGAAAPPPAGLARSFPRLRQ